jgi:hypothetical protein
LFIVFSSPIATQYVESFNGLTGAVTGVGSFNGLTGAVTGVTTGTANTFGPLQSFTSGISASGGTFSGNIRLQNAEYLQNTTNGRVDIMPAPTGSTHYGMSVDTTSWGFGVVLGTVRSSDGVLNNGNYRFDVPITIAAATRFQLGADGHYGLYRTDTGNNTAQLYALSNNANNSGAFALVNYFDVGTTNRSPTTLHTHPNFYIYANGSTGPNDFIRFEHNVTSGNIVSGGTTGIVIQPGSGTLTVSGNITANNIVNTINGLTGGVTLAAGTNITLVPSGNTITINSSGGGGGGSSVYGVTASIDFSANINGIEIVIYGPGNDISTSLQNIENNFSVTVVFGTTTLSFSCNLESIKSFYDATNGWSARLICKPLFTDISTSTGNYTAEQVIALNINAINLSIVPVLGSLAIDDYWTTFETPILYHQEETYVTKTLTGITWVTDSMFLSCKVLGLTSADHTAEDAILEGVNFEINNILGGTGFDVIGHAPNGTYGKYSIKCQGS